MAVMRLSRPQADRFYYSSVIILQCDPMHPYVDCDVPKCPALVRLQKSGLLSVKVGEVML